MGRAAAGRLVRVHADRSRRPRVGVLGPIVIEDRAGALIEPPGALAKALVATLAVAPRDVGGTVGVDAIVDELWGEAPPRNAKAALQTLVSRLRGIAADGLVVSHPGGYSLGVAAEELDLGAASALGSNRRSPGDEPTIVVARLDQALELWQIGRASCRERVL